MIFPPIHARLKNGTELTLRSPQDVDAPEFLAHRRTLFHESARHLNHPAARWDKETVEGMTAHLARFRDASKDFLVAAFTPHEHVVGSLGFVALANEGGFLAHSASLFMGLNSGYHGLGLGKTMLKDSLAFAHRQGFRHVQLTVRTYNDAGIGLYENVGFQKVGVLKEVACIDGQFVDEFLYQILL